METSHFVGLIPATHTPFHEEGSLNLDVIPQMAEHFLALRVPAVFVCGTTGESLSLTTAERQAVAREWVNATRNTALQVIVHVGHNSQADACELAKGARQIGAKAIAAMPPVFFKPASVPELVRFMEPVAGAAPDLPFYYYDIPSMTGVSLPAREFLQQAAPVMPNLAGLKFTNTDMVQLLECLGHEPGHFDILFGVDECLLAGLALGAEGAVGSSYNFAAPIYQRLIAAWKQGDLTAARAEQLTSIRLIRLLSRYGYMSAARHVMSLLGMPIGPARPPHRRLSADELQTFESELKSTGLWEAIQVRKN
jgi:N-acetylneuraminate lyase